MIFLDLERTTWNSVKTLLIRATVVEIIDTSPWKRWHPELGLIPAGLQSLTNSCVACLLNKRLVDNLWHENLNWIIPLRLAPSEESLSLATSTLYVVHQARSALSWERNRSLIWAMLLHTLVELLFWRVSLTISGLIAVLAIPQSLTGIWILLLTKRCSANTLLVLLLLGHWLRAFLAVKLIASRVGAAEDSESLWLVLLLRNIAWSVLDLVVLDGSALGAGILVLWEWLSLVRL